MLRRIALAALLALAPHFAGAQQAFVAPTAPAAANDNRIANTAWVRSLLSGAGGTLTNYYVATTGNDGNSCLTVALPCLTLQGAWNKIAIANYGANGAQLNIADGTYTGALVINGAWSGAGPLSIVGNCATPGNVILSPSGTSNITVTNAFVSVSCMELRNLSGGFAELLAMSGGDITFSNIRFGTTDGDQMQAAGGKIHGSGAYSIVGNMGSHGHARLRGLIDINNAVCTLPAGVTITNYFFGINDASVHFTSSSFAGAGAGTASTGLRALVHNSGGFDSGGVFTLTSLPGTGAVQLDASGRYDSFYVGDNLSWTAYTPTVTAQTGTPTTVSAVGRYKQNGKTVTAQATVTVTNHGTASGGLRATLPPGLTAAAFPYIGSSYEQNTTGDGGTAFIGSSGTFVSAIKAIAATNYWVDGYIVTIGITYEIP